MQERLRKKILRESLKKQNGGKSIVVAKYTPKYPDSVKREYLRLVNEYMLMERDIILKYIPELKRIINEGSARINTDSKETNEENRKLRRYEQVDNAFIRLRALFEMIRKELDNTFGLYPLKRKLNEIAGLEQKLSIREWKKTVGKTLGINLLEDYYSGELYKELLDKWVDQNVNLIKSISQDSLGTMKTLVYDNYMKGTTTTDIVKEIQRQYGMDKRHAQLIARDQTSKLNAAITQFQQRDAGVKKYIWDDSNDGGVRKSHHALNGKTFNWDDPPETEGGRRCHPGEDYQCRCCALPVFDIDELDLPV